MNVLDHLKDKTTEEVKSYCKSGAIAAGVAMVRTNGDFNLSTLVRNANFFNFNEVLYVGGRRHWDRRGSVGTHHYTDINHIKTENEFVDYTKTNGYTIVAVENNIPEYSHKTYDLFDDNVFANLNKPIFVFGEEQCGLNNYLLDVCERVVTIKAYGSVRSLNVGTASGIVMAFYRKFIDNGTK